MKYSNKYICTLFHPSMSTEDHPDLVMLKQGNLVQFYTGLIYVRLVFT